MRVLVAIFVLALMALLWALLAIVHHIRRSRRRNRRLREEGTFGDGSGSLGLSGISHLNMPELNFQDPVASDSPAAEFNDSSLQPILNAAGDGTSLAFRSAPQESTPLAPEPASHEIAAQVGAAVDELPPSAPEPPTIFSAVESTEPEPAISTQPAPESVAESAAESVAPAIVLAAEPTPPAEPQIAFVADFVAPSEPLSRILSGGNPEETEWEASLLSSLSGGDPSLIARARMSQEWEESAMPEFVLPEPDAEAALAADLLTQADIFSAALLSEPVVAAPLVSAPQVSAPETSRPPSSRLHHPVATAPADLPRPRFAMQVPAQISVPTPAAPVSAFTATAYASSVRQPLAAPASVVAASHRPEPVPAAPMPAEPIALASVPIEATVPVQVAAAAETLIPADKEPLPEITPMTVAAIAVAVAQAPAPIPDSILDPTVAPEAAEDIPESVKAAPSAATQPAAEVPAPAEPPTPRASSWIPAAPPIFFRPAVLQPQAIEAPAQAETVAIHIPAETPVLSRPAMPAFAAIVATAPPTEPAADTLMAPAAAEVVSDIVAEPITTEASTAEPGTPATKAEPVAAEPPAFQPDTPLPAPLLRPFELPALAASSPEVPAAIAPASSPLRTPLAPAALAAPPLVRPSGNSGIVPLRTPLAPAATDDVMSSRITAPTFPVARPVDYRIEPSRAPVPFPVRRPTAPLVRPTTLTGAIAALRNTGMDSSASIPRADFRQDGIDAMDSSARIPAFVRGAPRLSTSASGRHLVAPLRRPDLSGYFNKDMGDLSDPVAPRGRYTRTPPDRKRQA